MRVWKCRLRVAAVGLVMAMGAPALAQVNEDAAAFLRESASAIQNAKAFSYKAKVYGKGALATLIDAAGEVKQIRSGAEAKRSPLWAKGGVLEPGKGGKAQFEVSTDGRTVTWIDGPENKMYRRPFIDRTDALAQLSKAHQVALLELAEPAPFTREFKAERLEIVGAENVRGQACQVVRASWTNPERTTTWWIGIADHLPRKMEQAVGGGNEPLTKGSEYWDMTAVPTMTAEHLAIELPKGFLLDEQVAAVPKAQDPAAQFPQVPQAPPQVGLAVGADAPDFELRDSAGKTVKLSSLKGNVVVLSFWGPVFAKSDETNQSVQALGQMDKVKALGLACRADERTAVDYAREKNWTFPILTNADDQARAYRVNGFPTVYIIDAEGKVGKVIQGPVQPDNLRKAVETVASGGDGVGK